MATEPDIATVAGLLADPARAAILGRLMDGRAWTATELARVAGVKPATGSAHLAKLLAAEWVAVHAQGRYRYYHLADARVAGLLEQLSALAPEADPRTPGERRASRALRHCRLCYDHLAGRVGVALLQALRAQGYLAEGGGTLALTAAGRSWQEAHGLGLAESPGKPCMDWSERRVHLAGPLGRDLTAAFLAHRWLQRDAHTRALWVTPEGASQFERILGLATEDPDAPLSGRAPAPPR